MDIGDYIYKVYGMRMNVGDPNSHLNKAGRNVGINFYNQRKMVNTDDSHRLVELAKELNKEDEMVESIFHHYFEEGANISKKEELLKIGEKVLGDAITKEELESVLDGVKYQDAVDSQLKEAKGIRGVPYFVIYNPNNGRKFVSFLLHINYKTSF